MPVVEGLISIENDGKINFGNYLLDNKSKLDNVEFNGDLYKVKTFKEITKLEKNGMFVYESVPGTAVNNFTISEKEIGFNVEGFEDSQITMELEPSTEYKVLVDDANIGKMKTNISGKLNLSVELGNSDLVSVKIVKL